MPTSATSGRRTTPSRREPARTLSLSVQYASAQPGVPERPRLRRWVAAALERTASLTVRFIDEPEGRRLNRAFRGKNYPTNVLTFVYSSPDAARLQGDIVICAPVAAREAATQGIAPLAHLAHLVVHGVLHLQGYDHERDEDAATMEMRESQILGNLGFPDPYAG